MKVFLILSLSLIAPSTFAHTGHAAPIDASQPLLHFLTSPVHMISAVAGLLVLAVYAATKQRD